MDKITLNRLRESLEHARQLIDHCIEHLKTNEEIRAMRWRCRRCGYIKHFTRPMPAHVAPPCPKCHSAEFEIAP